MSFNSTLDPKHEYFSGLCAGLLSVIITYPINKLMFRQTFLGIDVLTSIRQLKIEGFGFLYRGVGPPLMIKPLTSSIMFGSYDQCYRFLHKDRTSHRDNYEQDDFAISTVSALVSGTGEAIISTPFERTQMILQDGRYNFRYTNMFDAMYQMKRYGLKEYYRGFCVTILRNWPMTMIYFTGINYAEYKILPVVKDHVHQRFVLEIMTGGFVGSLVSTIAYPMNVVRTRIQTQEMGTHHIHIKRAIQELFKERVGTNLSLFAGIYTNLFRSFLHWGLLTAFSDWFRNVHFSDQ